MDESLSFSNLFSSDEINSLDPNTPSISELGTGLAFDSFEQADFLIRQYCAGHGFRIAIKQTRYHPQESTTKAKKIQTIRYNCSRSGNPRGKRTWTRNRESSKCDCKFSLTLAEKGAVVVIRALNPNHNHDLLSQEAITTDATQRKRTMEQMYELKLLAQTKLRPQAIFEVMQAKFPQDSLRFKFRDVYNDVLSLRRQQPLTETQIKASTSCTSAARGTLAQSKAQKIDRYWTLYHLADEICQLACESERQFNLALNFFTPGTSIETEFLPYDTTESILI